MEPSVVELIGQAGMKAEMELEELKVKLKKLREGGKKKSDEYQEMMARAGCLGASLGKLEAAIKLYEMKV
jgi:hypothetical protein